VVDFVVIVPAPELDRHLFWDTPDPELVYRNPAALAREAVFGTVTPPINAIAVATEVALQGYSVEVVDVALEFGVPFTRDEIEQRYSATGALLQRLAPRCGVLITSLTAREHTAIVRLAEVVKEADADLPVCLGGYHANTLAEVFLRSPHIDLVLLGDFEPVSRSLLSLMAQRRVRDVTTANIMSKDADGAPRPTERHELRGEVNLSRFDYSVVARYLDLYGMLGVVASKGCPFPCTFCQERSLRTMFSLEEEEAAVAAGIEVMDAYEQIRGDRSIGFYYMDALFGAKHSWLSAFSTAMLRNGSPLQWTFQSRVDILGDCDFERLREAGCFLIHLGLESFSPTMLVRMQKTRNPQRYLSAFNDVMAKAAAADIDVEFNILFGAPGETAETLAETEAGIEETLGRYPRSSVNLNLYRLFPETTAFSSAYRREWGSDVLFPDWWLSGVVPEVTATVRSSDTLPPGELLKFFGRMYESDVCFRGRGDAALASQGIARGGFSVAELKQVASTSRDAFLRKTTT